MIDTHLHLFDPARHPFAADAAYQPAPEECADWPVLDELLQAHGMRRGVLVAPSAGYNHDLGPLTDTLAQAGGKLCGVARLRGDESDAVLDALAASGVLGVRLDLRRDGIDIVGELSATRQPQAWARRGWFVQVQAEAVHWARVAECLADWPNDLLVDHCGWPDTAAGLEQPGFQAVCALAARGRTWAKLSGPFRYSRVAWPHEDTDVFARRLVDVFGPQRCVWGSDWPFIRLAHRPEYGQALAHLARWVPDPDERACILGASAEELLDRGKA